MSSKSHIRVRVRATVRPRAPPRSGDATRTKKFASRDVADADPRPRASFARAVPSLSLFLSLSSLAPPSRLAPRRPDARASRAGETRRRRVRATTRSGDRRRERARRGREVDGVHPWMISSERGETRARSPDASTGLDRRTASCERSMASRRGRAVESSSRRPSRTRTASRHPSRPSPPAVRRPRINQSITLAFRNGVARGRRPASPRVRDAFAFAFVPSIDSTRLDARHRHRRVRPSGTRTDTPTAAARPSVDRTEHHHPSPTPRLDRTNAIDRSIDRSTRVPRLATRRRIGRFLSTRAAAAKTILRKTAATPRHQSHFPSSPPSRVSHASSEYRVIGFRNPAPRVPSRHRASTHERFTNRSIIHRVTSIVTRATDGGPRPDTHTHEGV